MHRPETEVTISQSQVRHPNHHITEPPSAAFHWRWESNRTRTERTELEPTFWVEPNRTRTGQLATDVELELNRTHSQEEPEPNKNPAVWVLKSSRN